VSSVPEVDEVNLVDNRPVTRKRRATVRVYWPKGRYIANQPSKDVGYEVNLKTEEGLDAQN